MTLATIQLDSIVGLSPRNVRGEVETIDVADLIASIPAMGLLQRLVVEEASRIGDVVTYAVIEGGRRWVALRSLAASAAIRRDAPVDVLVVDVDEAKAREISLAANVIRRDLHPVEEFEAFASLAAEGLSVERIAADFGATTRFVRQRLSLDKLSPRVRTNWRSGLLAAEAAQAFTAAPDHAAQDDYLDRYNRRELSLNAWNIRQHFAAEGTIKANAREALYVGLDAYQAAGGTIDDNLFEDWSICLDGALMKRLAREKMLDEGAAILEATGFGTCMIRDDVDQHWTWDRLPIKLTDDEKAALAEIDAHDQATDDPDDEDEASAMADAFEQEREVINNRAISRGSTVDERAQASIFLSLGAKGDLEIDYGRTRPAPASKKSHASMGATRSGDQTDAPITASAKDKPPTKAVVEVIDEACGAAFASLIADRPYLALMLCAAALKTDGNRSPLRMAAFSRNGLIKDAPASNFTAALTELFGLKSREELLIAFARMIAQTVVMDMPKNWSFSAVSGRADLTDSTALAEILATYTGADFQPALCAAFNYPAYFAAATRATALAAIEELGGDVNAARKAKADTVAATASELARDKGWLPKTLRTEPIARRDPRAIVDAPAPPEPSLVDAMADAIEADSPYPFGLSEPSSADEAVSDFVALHCAIGSPIGVSAFVLFDAFYDRMPPAWIDQIQTVSDLEDTLDELDLPVIDQGRNSLQTIYALDVIPQLTQPQAAE